MGQQASQFNQTCTGYSIYYKYHSVQIWMHVVLWVIRGNVSVSNCNPLIHTNLIHGKIPNFTFSFCISLPCRKMMFSFGKICLEKNRHPRKQDSDSFWVNYVFHMLKIPDWKLIMIFKLNAIGLWTLLIVANLVWSACRFCKCSQIRMRGAEFAENLQ